MLEVKFVSDSCVKFSFYDIIESRLPIYPTKFT